MKVCIIGCGKMGQAILGGWLGLDEASDVSFDPTDFFVVEHNEEKCAFISQKYGVDSSVEMPDLNLFDMVLLAVKPQVISGVIDALQDTDVFDQGRAAPLVVSIIAGITTHNLEFPLGAGVRVVRAMPNTPLQVGEGATVIAKGSMATEEDAAEVCRLFGMLGYASIVEESQIDAVCALSGGGPAYVALMIEALRNAGIANGLDPELAEKLIMTTFSGTCKMMQETGQTPEETRVAVCSPGGTTLAALGAMHDAGFEDSVEGGINAAVLRAKELAS